jgi:spore coat protein SA
MGDKCYLLYVGRLTPIKGVHVLIEAFREIHQRMPEVRLIITGSSFFGSKTKTAYEKKLMSLAEPVKNAIIFTGYLPHEKLKYLYSAVNVVVFPSVGPEAFGLVMLESMAAGTFLVASRVGGIPEVLESGDNGLLVEPGDAIDLAHAVCWVLDNPDEKHRMESAARQKILDGFTWGRLVGELEIFLGALK